MKGEERDLCRRKRHIDAQMACFTAITINIYLSRIYVIKF